MSYTLENIPDEIDRALRERAAAEQKTPESVIFDLVASGLNSKSHAGGWRDDHEFQVALREQGLIDWEAWSDGVKRRDLDGIAGLHLITAEMKEVFAEQRRIDPELWK